MDASVIAAIAKWPNVPAVYGWLSLTARGEWRLQGERIDNPAIVEFIGRNYAGDERGCWFFQNGPQRVFVDLEAAPWVWRLGPAGSRLETRAHTGAVARRLQGAWLDEQGRLFLLTEMGFGLVESSDIARAVDALRTSDQQPIGDTGLDTWIATGTPHIVLHGAHLGLLGNAELSRLTAAGAPERFNYVRAPRPA